MAEYVAESIQDEYVPESAVTARPNSTSTHVSLHILDSTMFPQVVHEFGKRSITVNMDDAIVNSYFWLRKGMLFSTCDQHTCRAEN